MTIPASQDPSLGFLPGDHVCAFYSGSRNMQAMVLEAFAHGYDSFRAVGDESFIIRNGVDIGEWFAAESALNSIVPDYPHFFFCLYDLDQFDGSTVMHVLRTHPRVTSMASSSTTRTTRQTGSPDS